MAILLWSIQSREGTTRPDSLLSQALSIGRATQGEEHPNTPLTTNKLAELYLARQNYSRAEEMFGVADRSKARLLGEEHPETLASMAGLGEDSFSNADTQRRWRYSARCFRPGAERSAHYIWDTLRTAAMINLARAQQRRHAQAEPSCASLVVQDQQAAPITGGSSLRACWG